MVELNKITYFAIFSLYFLSSSVSASCISASVSDEPFYVARKMTFHLYTRNTHTEYTLHGISGLKKKFSSEKLTKILVHGWHNGLNSTFVSTLHNGLDPAGPFFSIENLFMLNKDSAQFVDVIHTSMRAAGTRYKLGHVDFYPNGGTSGFNVLRSHRDAYEYFSESIANKRKFLAKRCESWAHFKSDNCPYFQFTDMGEYVSTDVEGRFFLQTNLYPPYARNTESAFYSTKVNIKRYLGIIGYLFDY
ncbi:pancreatic lipase-related protein 3-like isoform X3 [Cimex lectularius]|uniref:Lipase domain-containing protein n=1 Tax=Cimex lectularius TaxID=79782 RepID=A0A8I6RST3_CIMLE|nr:pancreatic lipase-related protein 3-like isoform X3 [Cimex lectularius]